MIVICIDTMARVIDTSMEEIKSEFHGRVYTTATPYPGVVAVSHLEDTEFEKNHLATTLLSDGETYRGPVFLIHRGGRSLTQTELNLLFDVLDEIGDQRHV